MMMMVYGSSSSSTGWVVGSKLSNDEYRECGGAGQKKIGKIRQQSCSFTQRGGGEIFVKTFFFYFKRNQTEAGAAIVSSEGTRGVTFPSFFSSDFDCIPKGFDE